MRRCFNVFVVLILATLSRAQVRGWEGTLVLPTYEEGMPDPNPPFDHAHGTRRSCSVGAMTQLQSVTSDRSSRHNVRVALGNMN
jgi:hypothetical protein